MSGEFALISRYFDGPQWRQLESKDRALSCGIGDDAALLQPPPGRQLAFSIDAAVAGVHFPEDAPARGVATRALGAALSDLAAMGASPLCFLLSLTLPDHDSDWLDDFSMGLLGTAQRWQLPLAGGDTVKGPLSVVIQVVGAVSPEHALRRDSAAAGDLICVSGELGKGAAGLKAVLDGIEDNDLEDAYWRPQPRFDLLPKLLGVASAAIDISDGLFADLGHIARASCCGARLMLESLPLCSAGARYFARDQLLDWALSGGDDYELCFTISEARCKDLGGLPQGCVRVGQLSDEFSGVICERLGKPVLPPEASGFQHF